MSEHATTGDGILTALQVLAADGRAPGRRCAELASVVTRLPQVLVNVPDVDKARTDDDGVLAAAVAASRTSWATPAGSCCARPAPSRWCG